MILSDCVKTIDPNQFEVRKLQDFDGYETVGGNDVTFLTGLMPLIAPSLVDYITELATAAAEKAGWRPHVSHLGIRCIEKLMYNPGGFLSFHLDEFSIYTLVLMFTDEKEYTGGEFQIENADGKTHIYKIPKYSGILFDSNKNHGITPLSAGERHIIVFEFWPYDSYNIYDKRPTIEEYVDKKSKVPTLIEVSV
jgi:hypothetical protein